MQLLVVSVNIYNIFQFKTIVIFILFLGIMSLGKSKKKLGKGGPILEKSEIPVETDAKKLVKFVCGSNILKEGQDIETKPDSEYPDWLWNLNTGE